MHHDVVKWINSCDSCNMRKGDPSNLIGKYRPPVVTQPWELVASDIVGPFPKTKNNNIYILLFVDYFTRYIEATAIPNNTAEIVANKFIELIICCHGATMKFLTDYGLVI